VGPLRAAFTRERSRGPMEQGSKGTANIDNSKTVDQVGRASKVVFRVQPASRVREGRGCEGPTTLFHRKRKPKGKRRVLRSWGGVPKNCTGGGISPESGPKERRVTISGRGGGQARD